MKKYIFIFSFLMILISCFVLSGCTHEMVSLYIYKMPNKLVYEIGEELDLTGLELKNIKTDSALLKIYNDKANFSGFDSQTSGKKEVKVSYGEFTTSFQVFVANKVAKNKEELKKALETANDNDIILIKEGEYKMTEPIEISNSNLVLGGVGKDKTIIDGLIVVGGNLSDGSFEYFSDIENLTLISLGFKTNNNVQNNIIKFDNENLGQNTACINAKNLTKFSVISCGFEGYSLGIKAENMDDVYISGNKFSNLLVGAIYSINSTKNVTISKNIINMIGNNVVNLNNKKEQDNIFGIKLALNSEENLGISIYKNSISKIANKPSNLKFFNEKIDGDFGGLNYLNKSGAIIIFSSGKNNLQTKGVSIFFNSIGSSLNNILYSTSDSDRVNSASVMYMSF